MPVRNDSTINLQLAPKSPPVDDSSLAIATTAYVLGQAGASNPLMDGAQAPGTSTRWARQDHVHPTDNTRAPLANPGLTGTPTAPTAAQGTSTTQIATTAFVIGQAGSAAPVMDGAASAGASTLYSRQDHVHPTDTSRAPLASPALGGTPTAPTPAAGDSSTLIATTAFVTGAITTAVLTGFTTPTASYTPVLADAQRVIEMNVAAGNTLTVPAQATTAFPIGTALTIVQLGAGQTTIAPAGGVTLRSYNGNLRSAGQYATVSLVKRGTNDWWVAGNLVP